MRSAEEGGLSNAPVRIIGITHLVKPVVKLQGEA